MIPDLGTDWLVGVARLGALKEGLPLLLGLLELGLRRLTGAPLGPTALGLLLWLLFSTLSLTGEERLMDGVWPGYAGLNAL